MTSTDAPSPVTTISRVGVVGAGTMGAGIAEVVAKSGVDTVVIEATPEAAEAGQARIQASMDKAVERGRLDAADRDATVARLTYTTDVADAAGCDLVIEAIIESEPLKLELFGRLDELLAPEAILASNTSSIPIVALASATNRPDQVLGMHFFNPAPVQPLVELVVSLSTSDATVASVEGFATDVLGKHVIHARDRAGFIVNRLLVPYLLSAIRMLDSGLATREDIDDGMKLGCAHPMGPLELCDLIGLDTCKSVADVLYEEFKELAYAPPPLLSRMVAAGQLGRKTGRGFYEY